MNEFERLEVNVQKERQKGRQFGPEEMWDTEEQFLSQFEKELRLIEDPEERHILKELLLDFSYIFYNENKPKFFREGIRVCPITLKTSSKFPVKDKQRKQADNKIPHIQKNIDKLLAEGVIEQVSNSMDTWLSNVHVVLESR